MAKSIEDTLVECNTCGAKIAHNSDKCPSCGKARSIYDRGFKLIMWIPIFILVFGFIIIIRKDWKKQNACIINKSRDHL